MKFGYVICDTANTDVYREASQFVVDELGYSPMNDELHDVDNSIWQTFKKGDSRIRIESDKQIDYVAIVSDVELPIECIREWKAA